MTSTVASSPTGTTGRADEIITAEVRPDLVREARLGWVRRETTSTSSATAVIPPSRAVLATCPYTFMRDLVAGRYRLPWEDEVAVKDGTGCGLPAPTRTYGQAENDETKEAAE